MLPPGDTPETLGSLSSNASDTLGAFDVTNEDIEEAEHEQKRAHDRVRDMRPLMRLALGITQPVNPWQRDIIARLDRDVPEWRSTMNRLDVEPVGILFKYLVESHYAEGRIDELVAYLKELPLLITNAIEESSKKTAYEDHDAARVRGPRPLGMHEAGCFPIPQRDVDDDVPIGEYMPNYTDKITPAFRLEATCSACGQRRPRRSLFSRVRDAITDWGLDFIQDQVTQLADMGFHIGTPTLTPTPLRTWSRGVPRPLDDHDSDGWPLYPGPGGDLFAPRYRIDRYDQELPQEHNFERWQTGIFR